MKTYTIRKVILVPQYAYDTFEAESLEEALEMAEETADSDWFFGGNWDLDAYADDDGYFDIYGGDEGSQGHFLGTTESGELVINESGLENFEEDLI